jgi:hypothetical protein
MKLGIGIEIFYWIFALTRWINDHLFCLSDGLLDDWIRNRTRNNTYFYFVTLFRFFLKHKTEFNSMN